MDGRYYNSSAAISVDMFGIVYLAVLLQYVRIYSRPTVET